MSGKKISNLILQPNIENCNPQLPPKAQLSLRNPIWYQKCNFSDALCEMINFVKFTKTGWRRFGCCTFWALAVLIYTQPHSYPFYISLVIQIRSGIRFSPFFWLVSKQQTEREGGINPCSMLYYVEYHTSKTLRQLQYSRWKLLNLDNTYLPLTQNPIMETFIQIKLTNIDDLGVKTIWGI